VWWGWFLCDECQLEVIDDPVHHGRVDKEDDDLHPAAALRTKERVNLVGLI